MVLAAWYCDSRQITPQDLRQGTHPCQTSKICTGNELGLSVADDAVDRYGLFPKWILFVSLFLWSELLALSLFYYILA